MTPAPPLVEYKDGLVYLHLPGCLLILTYVQFKAALGRGKASLRAEAKAKRIPQVEEHP